MGTNGTIRLRARGSRMTPATAQLWADLRRELQRSIDAASTPSYFETVRSRSPSVRPFASVGALLRYLGEDLGADLDAKSAIFSDKAHAIANANTFD